MKIDTTVIVFGAGRFGTATAKKLFELGVEVMVVDKDYDLVQEIANDVTTAVQCDLFDEKAVNELGIANFDVAIIAIGSDLESSILATLAAKDRKVPNIIAKATTAVQARILEKLGADKIIFPELDMGERLARSITGSSIFEYIHLSDEYTILEVQVLDSWIGKTLLEMDFRKKYHMNVIAFRRDNQTMISNLGDKIIEANDDLILIGKYSDAEKLEKNK